MSVCTTNREGNVINHLRVPGFQSGKRGVDTPFRDHRAGPGGWQTRVKGRQRTMEFRRLHGA